LAQQGLAQLLAQAFFLGANGQLVQLLRVSADATRASVRSAFMGVWCCWMRLTLAESPRTEMRDCSEAGIPGNLKIQGMKKPGGESSGPHG
jgi:hypothetical protein